MSTLTKIASEKVNIWKMIEESGGEIDKTIEFLMTDVDQHLSEKVDHYQFVQQDLATEAARLRQTAKSFADAAKVIENVSDRLNERIKYAMNVLGTTELRGDNYIYKLSKPTTKLVIDSSILSMEYKIQVSEYVPDKEKIQADLLEGKQISGAHFETVNPLRCSINKGNNS